MPRAFFADAWYFIALLEPRDTHHRNARRLSQQVHGQHVVTHDGVLTEVLTYFAEEDQRARSLAVQAVRNVLAELDVRFSDRELFLRAVDRYDRRLDKHYSLTDCMSMVVMEDRGIRHILTNDHHFTQAGFIIVNQ